ncbi:uncharacterized protein LOC128850290 isoform X1 [Cuculus canorus]|uniref:uncharacterized protein LOC128850290 isoform X1 n=1 Tax=Cuculus canorus TaxID=55661 RepID=UPI0023AA52E0|nr:uncharacterized protein LOC128850290 isoform X1 [Cuculus canorus]
MDNQTLEMDGEDLARPSRDKEGPKKEVQKMKRSLLKVFLMCLLACVVTTTLGVLILSLVYLKNPLYLQVVDLKTEGPPSPKPEENNVDIKFQFLNHLQTSKVHRYPGGEIQWGRFREDLGQYDSPQEMTFGQSLNRHRSKMTFATLKIKSRGLRVPHWHFNANEHGYVLQGSVWVGVISSEDPTVTTYTVSAGQVFFFPRNTVHWLKNVGLQDCVLLLFFSTHHELQTMDVDDAFFSTPEDIVARAFKPRGGVNFIRTFKKQLEDQAVNLPPNLDLLLHNVTYGQSPAEKVWRYFYDLQGSATFPFPGGLFQWAPYQRDTTTFTHLEKIFSDSLNTHEDTLTLATLRIFSNSLGQPHYHFNANEMGYVVSGCGEVGLILSGVSSNFNIAIGDVFFFPVGTQHYIKSTCEEDLLLLLAYSTGEQLETLRMKDYFRLTVDHVLAQLFWKDQKDFQNFSGSSRK